MENGILMSILLDIKNTYKAEGEDSHYNALEKTEQAIDCINLLIDSWHRTDLDNELAILKKVKEAVERHVDSDKFEKFITEAIFM